MSEETNLDSLSDERLKELIDNRKKFMKDQLPALRMEDEYSRLTANIAENKLRGLMSKLKYASLKAPKVNEEEENNEKKEES